MSDDEEWVKRELTAMPPQFASISGWHAPCSVHACDEPGMIVRHSSRSHDSFLETGEVSTFVINDNCGAEHRVTCEVFPFTTVSRARSSIPALPTDAITPMVHSFSTFCADHYLATSQALELVQEFYIRESADLGIKKNEILTERAMLAHFHGKTWYPALERWIMRHALWSSRD